MTWMDGLIDGLTEKEMAFFENDIDDNAYDGWRFRFFNGYVHA